MLLCIMGCAERTRPDFAALMTQLTPTTWRQAGAWNFHISGREQESLGHITLRLTGESIDLACDENDWKRAIVVENKLKYDFGFALQPAYRFHGHWLTVDLTAANCGADHLLNGEMKNSNATGFFNYSHRLGGNNIGTFIAIPVAK